MHPPRGRYVHIDGIRLHVIEQGSGTPVLLIHGNAVTVDDFAASGLVDELARSHRVIAIERPGFGHSLRPRDRLWTPATQAALLHRALVALDVQRAVVVGHSMGTMVAEELALQQPQAVAGLALLGGYYYPTLRVDAILTAPVALPVIGDAMRYTVTAVTARLVIERLVSRIFAPRPVPAGYFEAVPRELMVRPPQLRANAEDATFMMPAARDLAHRHHQLELPLLLVAGLEDKAVDPQAHTARLARELGAKAELVLVPQAGHMVHHLPDVAQRIARFAQECFAA